MEIIMSLVILTPVHNILPVQQVWNRLTGGRPLTHVNEHPTRKQTGVLAGRKTENGKHENF